MKQLRNILTGVLLGWGLLLSASVQADSIPVAQNGLAAELDSIAQRDDVTPAEQEKNTVNVKEIVFGHIGDSYEWHITAFGETHVIIPLPVIVYSSTTGWHTFLSSRLEENGGSYEGLSIAPEGSKRENWWNTMPQVMRCVLGIYPLRKLRWHCLSIASYCLSLF